ncbi:MAG: permease [Bacillota bacterium]
MKKNIINILAFLAYLVAFLVNKNLFFKAINISLDFLKEMISILPAVMIISGLISVWAPREMITKNFGKTSGLKGKLISIFIGSVSAGPIYAAFPFTQTLLNKGASIANVVIILSSWAVMKIPMLIVEIKFLGFSFAAVRYLLTFPLIILIGYIVDRLTNREEILSLSKKEDEKVKEINEVLPNLNCKSCGFESCKNYARAIIYENAKLDLCIPSEESVSRNIEKIIENHK